MRRVLELAVVLAAVAILSAWAHHKPTPRSLPPQTTRPAISRESSVYRAFLQQYRKGLTPEDLPPEFFDEDIELPQTVLAFAGPAAFPHDTRSLADLWGPPKGLKMALQGARNRVGSLPPDMPAFVRVNAEPPKFWRDPTYSNWCSLRQDTGQRLISVFELSPVVFGDSQALLAFNCILAVAPPHHPTTPPGTTREHGYAWLVYEEGWQLKKIAQ